MGLKAAKGDAATRVNSSSSCGHRKRTQNRLSVWGPFSRKPRDVDSSGVLLQRLPDEQVETSLRSQALAQALAALSDRERQVILLRYGLADQEPKTLEEIGRRLGLTRERVRKAMAAS